MIVTQVGPIICTDGCRRTSYESTSLNQGTQLVQLRIAWTVEKKHIESTIKNFTNYMKNVHGETVIFPASPEKLQQFFSLYHRDIMFQIVVGH